MPTRFNRSVWFLAVGLACVLFAAAVPFRHAQLARLAPGGWPAGWSHAAWQAGLDRLGLSADFFASYQLAIEIVLAAVFAAAATVIARRRSAPIALLAAVALLMSGLALLPVLAALPPGLHDLVRALRAAAWLALAALLLLFPDGRFRPPWTGWLLLAWAGYQLAAMVVPALAPPLHLAGLSTPQPWLAAAVHAAALAAGVLFQYRRARTDPDPAARQQSRWLGFSALAIVLGGAALLLPHWLGLLPAGPGLSGVVYGLLSVPLLALLLLLWPLAAATAATRAGLWELDFFIHRALVYGPLLAALGGLSGALLFVLERALPAEPVLTFAVTAVLAGLLFRPLRYRLRGLVDRRVYRVRIDYRARPSPSGPALTHSQLGPYHRLQAQGTSEFGQSFRALRRGEPRPVTLHVLPPALSADPAFAARFERELAPACELQHAGLARVYDSGLADGRLYAASEYVVGQDLSSFLLINGRLGLGRALPVMAELAAALDYLHAQGQAHGDVRLANVMLVLREPEQMPRDARFASRVAFLPTAAFRTVLLHVGLARALRSGQHGSALAYLAPERIRGEPPGARADLYALGVIAYQMLAGMLPYAQPGPDAVVLAHLRQAPPDPRARVPGLPAALAEALLRSIAKDPEARFETASEFVRALESD